MTTEKAMGRNRAAALSIIIVAVVAALLSASPAGAASSDDHEPGPCISNDAAGDHPFVDVGDGLFYSEPVRWAYNNGITTGVDDTHYGPDSDVSRGQFATMLHRMACLPAPGGVADFDDLRDGAFYRDAVDWMVGEAITTGKTPTVFGPDDSMTRGEFATFLFRFVGEPAGSPEASAFGDLDRARFYALPVDWLLFRSVTQGTSSTTFGPERTITRAEIATFLYRLNTIGDVALLFTTVLTGLDSPTAAALDPTNGDIYITERSGDLIRVAAGADGLPDWGTLSLALAVDTGNAVISGDERGLLGAAVSPDGTAIYLSFTADADSGLAGVSDGDSVIVEYGLAGGVVDSGSARLVIEVDQPQDNHNGGNIVFGPDGYLYASFGDGGGGNDDDDGHTAGVGNGQDITNLLGAILRIDPTGATYSVPADNPFVGIAGEDEIWLFGVRNPWKFTFDRETGDLWVADVGQGAREEITRLEASTSGGKGANLGWRLREGTIPTPGGVGGPEPPGHVGPIHEYINYGSSGGVGCSITGGFAYRGSDVPALDGVYIYSDYCNPVLRGWRDDYGIEAVEFTLDVPGSSPVAFFEDSAGGLYVLSIGGTVSKLDRAVS